VNSRRRKIGEKTSSAGLERGDTRHTRPTEWVRDDIAGARIRLNEWLDGLWRYLGVVRVRSIRGRCLTRLYPNWNFDEGLRGRPALRSPRQFDSRRVGINYRILFGNLTNDRRHGGSICLDGTRNIARKLAASQQEKLSRQVENLSQCASLIFAQLSLPALKQTHKRCRNAQTMCERTARHVYSFAASADRWSC
jgi:hypothetical protein